MDTKLLSLAAWLCCTSLLWQPAYCEQHMCGRHVYCACTNRSVHAYLMCSGRPKDHSLVMSSVKIQQYGLRIPVLGHVPRQHVHMPERPKPVSLEAPAARSGLLRGSLPFRPSAHGSLAALMHIRCLLGRPARRRGGRGRFGGARSGPLALLSLQAPGSGAGR